MNRTYDNLDDILARKTELRDRLREKREALGSLWSTLSTPKKANTKGEMIATIISNSITAFDAFMLVRKLMTQYGSLFSHRGGKRR